VKEYRIVDPKAKAIEVMTLGEAGFEFLDTYGKQEALRSSYPGLSINLPDGILRLNFAIFRNLK